MIHNLFLLIYLIATIYFFIQMKRKKNQRALNGFSAGVFLVIFIVRGAPVLANLLKNYIFSS